MVYGINEEALKNKETIPDGKIDRLTCCRVLETEALKNTLNGTRPPFRFNHEKNEI